MLRAAVELYRRLDGIPAVRVAVPEFLRELAPDFLCRQRLGLFDIAGALGRGEFEPVQRFAHNLKGCGSGYGFPRLTDLGREMERAAKDRDLPTLHLRMRDLSQYLAAVDIE
jgi:hypothetical protein